jgi:hypothetical protein
LQPIAYIGQLDLIFGIREPIQAWDQKLSFDQEKLKQQIINLISFYPCKRIFNNFLIYADIIKIN